jgi:hypothetical protein
MPAAGHVWWPTAYAGSALDPWTIIGLGGGGTMMPTISPHDPKIVVEHCDMTGAYITLDGAFVACSTCARW